MTLSIKMCMLQKNKIACTFVYNKGGVLNEALIHASLTMHLVGYQAKLPNKNFSFSQFLEQSMKLLIKTIRSFVTVGQSAWTLMCCTKPIKRHVNTNGDGHYLTEL